jgi:anti-sigma factor RsiW
MTTFSGHLTDAQAQRLVDGVPRLEEASEVESHAACCAECQALVESYRALEAALEGLEPTPLPADFTKGVIARIETRERAAARERRLAAAISAAVLAAITATALAGSSVWVPAAARLVDQMSAAGRALQVGAEVLPPLVSALRLPIAALCAVVAFPVLFALSRLIPSQRTEIA